MGFFESIRLAFNALSANKMRSLLTMLGIIIGISAVITITTIGNSIQQTLSNTFNQFGMNIFYLYLTPDYNKVDFEDEDFDFTFEVTEDDLISDEALTRLLEEYPDRYKLAMSEGYNPSEIINENDEYINVTVQGITDGYLDYGKIDIISGRNISQRDNTEKKHTMLVSDIFVNQYFDENTNPLGKTLSFTMDTGESYDFTIVGVYEYSESKLGKFEAGIKEIEKQTPVFIPLKTLRKISGIDADSGYDYAMIMWNPDYDVIESELYLTEFFEEEYKDNRYWTVYIENEQSILDMINAVINVITIAISVIAAISLIVGGVGVMNIMLVSITERTREIGVRKALGAQNSSIRIQFVIEAIIICLVGGIIGIIIGILNGLIIGELASYIVTTSYPDYMDIITISVSPSLSAIAIAVIFSMLTGVFFGYYPANKAAKMNPIDALRYE